MGREYHGKKGQVICLNCGARVTAEKQNYSEMYKVDCGCGKTYYLDEYGMYSENQKLE